MCVILTDSSCYDRSYANYLILETKSSHKFYCLNLSRLDFDSAESIRLARDHVRVIQLKQETRHLRVKTVTRLDLISSLSLRVLVDVMSRFSTALESSSISTSLALIFDSSAESIELVIEADCSQR